MSAVNKGGQRS